MAPQGETPNQEIFRRLKAVENGELISKTRFSTLLGVGTLFWGIAFAYVSGQLSDIKQMGIAIAQLESSANLLSYRLDRQDEFNRNLLSNEAEYKKVVQQRYDYLAEQVATIYHSRRNE